ncbi:MAG: CoA transferase [Gammaproteobacteria bacterium]|nr:CoA transferase [Gammaproteobacteria bacterium]
MPANKLLSGYNVLDLSQYIPGPYAARSLADLGAQVIKIEPPAGDPMRNFICAGNEGEASPIYRHLNRGKTIAVLNLKNTQDKQHLARLLRGADVLLESYRPGVMARLGFDRDRLQAINPRLVHCALSGFGQTGPFRDRAGHDLTYCAVAGALCASGTEKQPVLTYPPVADHAGAMQAVNAVLAALLHRERSGRGAFLDISLTESILAWQYVGLSESQHETRQLRERLLLNGGAACYNIYTTSDGRFVTLAALETKFWKAFCCQTDHPEWIARHQEPLPQKDLIAELQALFSTQPLSAWQNLLAETDCCFEPIPAFNEIATHPQFEARASITGVQPGYPGWINGEPVETASDYVELAAGETPLWR